MLSVDLLVAPMADRHGLCRLQGLLCLLGQFAGVHMIYLSRFRPGSGAALNSMSVESFLGSFAAAARLSGS